MVTTELASEVPFFKDLPIESILGFAWLQCLEESEPKILSQMVGLDGEESHGIPIRKNSPNKKQIQVITRDPTCRTPKNHGKMKVLNPQYRGYNVIPGDSAAVTQLDPRFHRWRSPFPTFDFGSRIFTHHSQKVTELASEVHPRVH